MRNKATLKLIKDFTFEVRNKKYSFNQFLMKLNILKYIRIEKQLKINDEITMPEQFWVDLFKEIEIVTGEKFIKSVFKKDIRTLDAPEYLDPIILYKGNLAREIYLCRIVMSK